MEKTRHNVHLENMKALNHTSPGLESYILAVIWEKRAYASITTHI